MPRAKKQGGPREGVPGEIYPNRSDLRDRLPVTTVPGQQYGRAAEQRAAQQRIPMGTPPLGVQSPPVAGGGQAVQAGGQPGGAPPPSGMAPGELKFLHPSERPNEPIQHGLPLGPGAGPEALLPAPVTAQSNLRDVFEAVANAPFAPPELKNIARNI